MSDDEYVCLECRDYRGSIRGLCSHVGKGHDIDWATYTERHDVDTEQLSRENKRNAQRGWDLKLKQMRRNR